MMIERYQQRGHENELKNQVDGVVLIEVRFYKSYLILSLSLRSFFGISSLTVPLMLRR